jgi:hypothetical protein
MIPISITAEALVAIAKSFPMGWRAEGSLDGKGGYLLVLPRGVADLLRAIRQPGETFSDVILRVTSERRQLNLPDPRLNRINSMRIGETHGDAIIRAARGLGGTSLPWRYPKPNNIRSSY